jgi:hypothetical protein
MFEGIYIIPSTDLMSKSFYYPQSFVPNESENSTPIAIIPGDQDYGPIGFDWVLNPQSNW